MMTAIAALLVADGEVELDRAEAINTSSLASLMIWGELDSWLRYYSDLWGLANRLLQEV